MNDYERISKVLEYLKLNASALSRKLGLKNPQVFYDIKAKKCGISKDLANKIQDKFFDIDKTWLLTGEGEMLKTSPDSTVPAKSYITGVPYYNVDFIGGFDLVLNDQTINPEYLIDFKQYNKATVWCNITGHSMEPEITNGDIVALKEIPDFSFLPFGEIYAIITTNGMRTIKRIGPASSHDCYSLIPTNKSPEYGVQEIPKKMIYKVYAVLGCMKKL